MFLTSGLTESYCLVGWLVGLLDGWLASWLVVGLLPDFLRGQHLSSHVDRYLQGLQIRFLLEGS